MKRPWGIRPDPETGVLSREALIQGLIDAATLLDIAGGCLQVVVGRAATDMPGEMVMTGAALTWQDRTDATAAPEQPVTVTPPEAHTEIEEEPEHDRWVNTETGEELTVTAVESIETTYGPTPSDDNPDGFDLAAMPEEDLEDETVGSPR